MADALRFSDRESPPTPALVLDAAKVRANVARLAAFAAGHGIAVRPHTKTHQSVEVARLQLARGAPRQTGGQVGEAEAIPPAH